MYDIIILGGGAAGLAAAAYAQSKQCSVLLIAEEVGGKAGTQQQLHDQVGEEALLGAEAVRVPYRSGTARPRDKCRENQRDLPGRDTASRSAGKPGRAGGDRCQPAA